MSLGKVEDMDMGMDMDIRMEVDMLSVGMVGMEVDKVEGMP
jgi:hypothetical protein